MVRLCINAPGPHLLGQAVGRGEDERLPPAEQLVGSRDLTGASAAVEIVQSMPDERISMGRCGAVGDVVASAPVLGFGLVCGMVLRAKDSLAFVSPLGGSDSLGNGRTTRYLALAMVFWNSGQFAHNAIETRVLLHNLWNVGLDTLELVVAKRGFLDVYAVCGHADSLVGRETSKHLEKVNVRISQYTSPEMGKLGLAAVVVCEDPTSRALFGGTYQGPALPAVTNEKVEFALVRDKSACT